MKQKFINSIREQSLLKKPIWLLLANHFKYDFVFVVAKYTIDKVFPRLDGPYPLFVNKDDYEEIYQYYELLNKDGFYCEVWNVKELNEQMYVPDCTITGLKRYESLLKDAKLDIDGAIKFYPDYIDINEQFKAISISRDRIVSKHRMNFKSLEDGIDIAVDKIRQEKPKKEIILSEKMAKWLKESTSGLSGGSKHKIVWCSEDRYGILYVPGGSFWSGRGQNYAQSKCYLFDLNSNNRNIYGRGIILEFPDGQRFSKAMIAVAEDIISKQAK